MDPISLPDLITALNPVFDLFVAGKTFPERAQARPAAFLAWLREEPHREPAVAVMHKAGVPGEHALQVMALPGLITGLLRLLPAWPYLVLKFREQVHPVRAVGVALTVHYEDGTVAILNRAARVGFVGQEEIRDADAVSLLLRATDLAEQVQVGSLDSLHDQFADTRGCLEPEVVAALYAAARAAPGLTDEGKARAGTLLGLLQAAYPGSLSADDYRRICPPDPRPEGVA